MIHAKNRVAQEIARETMRALHGLIRAGMSEAEIRRVAEAEMVARASNGWWYHGIGALVLLGKRSVESMPGRQYVASDENCVAENDVITIDLAPTVDGYWGDYARTIFVENGLVAPPDAPRSAAYRQGLDVELHLHQVLVEIARPEMTYEDVYRRMNVEIARLGFENLDVHGNLGHSVEMDERERIYLEQGSTRSFAEVGKAFTFEPHIRVPGTGEGFKREDIYYFDASSALRRL